MFPLMRPNTTTNPHSEDNSRSTRPELRRPGFFATFATFAPFFADAGLATAAALGRPAFFGPGAMIDSSYRLIDRGRGVCDRMLWCWRWMCEK